jgi:subtilisin family serine protease
VRFVERDRPLTRSAVVPTDPRFPEQWGLESPRGVDIDAPRAWGFTTGRAETIVAVIDSGLDTRHPDLASRLWTNPLEIPGNGRDDDANGYADDVHGWNFLANTADVRDDDGHGTQVAGIIAASANGGGAVAGIDWRARVMPLKFIDAQGDGFISDAVRAIRYAVDNGARVINASWGTPDPSPALNRAIRDAGRRGVVFVTAAGNDARNTDVDRSYPASLRQPGMITVAALNPAGRLAAFSNNGPHTVHLAAPGVRVLTTDLGGGYATISGTSMAAPFATGVAALVAAQNPTWGAAEIVQRIVATARPLRSLRGQVLSGGLLDAGAALDPAVPPRARVISLLRSR